MENLEDVAKEIDLGMLEELLEIYNEIESTNKTSSKIKEVKIESKERLMDKKWKVEISKYTQVVDGENNITYWIDKDNNKYDYDPNVREEIEKHTTIGNIFDCKENIIVHQVNMYKKMGSGIAKQIRERFPNVYESYMQHDGELGEVYIVPVNVEVSKGLHVRKFIANMYSQNNYGYDGMQYTNYDAMRKAFNELAYHMVESDKCGNNMSLAIPYGIGCGLGGGDWNVVSRIICDELGDVRYRIYKLNK